MVKTQEEYRQILEQRLTEGLLGNIGNIAKRSLATLAVGAMTVGAPAHVTGNQYGNSSTSTSTHGSQTLERSASNLTTTGRSASIPGIGMQTSLPSVNVVQSGKSLVNPSGSSSSTRTKTTVGSHAPVTQTSKEKTGSLLSFVNNSDMYGGSQSSSTISKGAAKPVSSFPLTGKTLETTRRRV